MDKQKFIIALQSKVNLLTSKLNKAENEKYFVSALELQIQIKSYNEIMKVVINGNFDK